jgi:hypothetical protein
VMNEMKTLITRLIVTAKWSGTKNEQTC